MSKEILDNQEETPIVESGEIKEPGLEGSRQALQDFIETASASEKHVVESGEKITESFPDNPEVFTIIKKANQEVRQEKEKSQRSVLEILRHSRIGREFIPIALSGGLMSGLLQEIDNYYSNKDEAPIVRNIRQANIEEDSQEEEALPTEETVRNLSPNEYDLTRIYKINHHHLDRQEKAATDSVLAKKMIADQIYKKRFVEAKKDLKKKTPGINLSNISSDIIKEAMIDRNISDLNDEIEMNKSYLKDIEGNKEADEDLVKDIRNTLAELQKRLAEAISGQDAEFKLEDHKLIERAPLIMKIFQEAKGRVLNTIKDSSYVDRLMKEFKINRAKALKHQQVRIKNVDNAEAVFEFSKDIDKESGGYAYFSNGTNKVTIPLDVEIDDFFQTAIEHELHHESTNGNSGLSLAAQKILSETTYAPDFTDKDSVGDQSDNDYYKKATERYVRLKILQNELIDMGIMKRGEKFTKEIYREIIDTYYNDPNCFGKNSRELISHMKDLFHSEKGYENFRKLFDDLAESGKQDNTYYHPNWNYNQPEGQA